MNSETYNSVDQSKPFWEQSPRKLVSLWDMVKSSVIGFVGALDLLEMQEKGAHAQVKEFGLGWP